MQDPVLEGERVLHDLENVPPLDLLEQLLAVALSCSVQLLCQGPGFERGSLAVQPMAEVTFKYRR
jgi:hypothetical protein